MELSPPLTNSDYCYPELDQLRFISDVGHSRSDQRTIYPRLVPRESNF
jgi:hypothetical protein